MLLLITYMISAITWGWILIELVIATIRSIKANTDTPSLIIPLALASLSLFVESAYFLIANIFRYIANNENMYMIFLEQEHLFAVRVLMAISGILMLLKLKIDKR